MNFNTFLDYEVLIYVENGNSWMEFSSDDNHISIVSGFWDYDNDETEVISFHKITTPAVKQ